MTTQAYWYAFKRAQMEVVEILSRKAVAESLTEYETQLIAEVSQIMTSLGIDTRKWLESAVPSAYRSAEKSVITQLQVRPIPSVAFEGINQAVINVIIRDSKLTMDTSLFEVGRRLNDQIREAGLRATERKLTLNQTLREMQRDLLREFKEQGYVMGVPDSRGRMQNLNSYTEMYTRSVTRETTNTATMDTGHALNNHLFKLSTHYPTCKLCAPRQGRVYRDIDFPAGDERNRFPHISMAFPGWPQFRNIHPRCRHVLIAIGWDALSRETQLQYLADAGKPFNVDPRGEKEIEAYDLGQAQHRMMWNDRRQWQKMQARLGKDAPTTFSAFRRLKYSDGGINKACYGEDDSGNRVLRCGKEGNSERWNMLQLDYRRRGALLRDPDAGLPNAANVSIDDRKFTQYIFDKNNPEGWAKGIAFSSRLGYNQKNWDLLKQEIGQRAALYPAGIKRETEYGVVYEQRMVLYGLKNNPTNVVVGWMTSGDSTKMTTAYVKEV